MLFQLDKMRKSEEYNEELRPDAMRQLSKKFLPLPEWNLAAQDWFSLLSFFLFFFIFFRFSLLSWAKPHLVASLPCRYNVLQCSTGIGAVTNSNISCSQEIAIAHFCGST